MEQTNLLSISESFWNVIKYKVVKCLEYKSIYNISSQIFKAFYFQIFLHKTYQTDIYTTTSRIFFSLYLIS